MPSTPGLCGLLAMMFCPKLEFRTDENNSMYTGCVTGLGVDPVNNCSVYPDHDMEIVFDTVIDNEDISLVSFVSYSSSKYLKNNRFTASGSTNFIQKILIPSG